MISIARIFSLRSLVTWLAIFLSAADIYGKELDPVTAAESALRDTKAPWYDAEQDAVRVVSLKSESTTGERQDWRGDGPQRPDWKWDWDWEWWNWGSGNGTAGGTTNFQFPTFGEILQFIGWLLLLSLLGALVYALVRTFLKLEPAEPSLVGRKALEEEIRTDEQRIRELPVNPSQKKGDFLSIARDSYESGQYAEAIVFLFSHRLIQLDRAGMIRLTRGKTNRQYLYEISRSTPMCEILGRTILCFEDVFFGKHELSRERFEQTWEDNETFDRILQDSTARI